MPTTFHPFSWLLRLASILFETTVLCLLGRGSSSALKESSPLNSPRIIAGIDPSETVEFGTRLFCMLTLY